MRSENSHAKCGGLYGNIYWNLKIHMTPCHVKAPNCKNLSMHKHTKLWQLPM